MMCTYVLAGQKMWKIQYTGKHHRGRGVIRPQEDGIRLAGQELEQRPALPLHLGQGLLPPWQHQHSPRQVHLQPAGRGHCEFGLSMIFHLSCPVACLVLLMSFLVVHADVVLVFSLVRGVRSVSSVPEQHLKVSFQNLSVICLPFRCRFQNLLLLNGKFSKSTC